MLLPFFTQPTAAGRFGWDIKGCCSFCSQFGERNYGAKTTVTGRQRSSIQLCIRWEKHKGAEPAEKGRPAPHQGKAQETPSGKRRAARRPPAGERKNPPNKEPPPADPPTRRKGDGKGGGRTPHHPAGPPAGNTPRHERPERPEQATDRGKNRRGGGRGGPPPRGARLAGSGSLSSHASDDHPARGAVNWRDTDRWKEP